MELLVLLMIASLFSSSVFVSLSFVLVVVWLIEFHTDQIIKCTKSPVPMGCCKQNRWFYSLKTPTPQHCMAPIKIVTNITAMIGTILYRNEHHCNEHHIVLQRSSPQQTQLYHSATNIIEMNMLDWYQTRHCTALQQTRPYCNKQKYNERNHIASHPTGKWNKQHHTTPQQTEPE